VRPQFGLQPPVLQRDRSTRGHHVEQGRLLAQRRVVDQGRQWGAVVPDDGGGPFAVAVSRHLGGLAVLVGPGGVLRQPVQQGQRRVAQRLGEYLAQVARVLAQPHEQVAGGRPAEVGVEQTDEERHRREAEHEQRQALHHNESGPGEHAPHQQDGGHPQP
jgi:hypothetical protein